MRLTDRAILIYLAELKHPISQDRIAEELDCGAATVKRSIKRLVAAGYISPCGFGRGKPFSGYDIHYEKLPESLKLKD